MIIISTSKCTRNRENKTKQRNSTQHNTTLRTTQYDTQTKPNQTEAKPNKSEIITLMMYRTELDRSGLFVSAADSSFCVSTTTTITTEIATSSATCRICDPIQFNSIHHGRGGGIKR